MSRDHTHAKFTARTRKGVTLTKFKQLLQRQFNCARSLFISLRSFKSREDKWNFLLTLYMSLYETFLFLTITAADGHKIHHRRCCELIKENLKVSNWNSALTGEVTSRFFLSKRYVWSRISVQFLLASSAKLRSLCSFNSMSESTFKMKQKERLF